MVTVSSLLASNPLWAFLRRGLKIKDKSDNDETKRTIDSRMGIYEHNRKYLQELGKTNMSTGVKDTSGRPMYCVTCGIKWYGETCGMVAAGDNSYTECVLETKEEAKARMTEADKKLDIEQAGKNLKIESEMQKYLLKQLELENQGKQLEIEKDGGKSDTRNYTENVDKALKKALDSYKIQQYTFSTGTGMATSDTFTNYSYSGTGYGGNGMQRQSYNSNSVPVTYTPYGYNGTAYTFANVSIGGTSYIMYKSIVLTWEIFNKLGTAYVCGFIECYEKRFENWEAYALAKDNFYKECMATEKEIALDSGEIKEHYTDIDYTTYTTIDSDIKKLETRVKDAQDIEEVK